MSATGSLSAAISSLKNNRNLLKHRKNKALSGSYVDIKLKEFPKATPQQLVLLRKKVQQDRKKSKIRLISSLVTFLVFVFSIFYYLIT